MATSIDPRLHARGSPASGVLRGGVSHAFLWVFFSSWENQKFTRAKPVPNPTPRRRSSAFSEMFAFVYLLLHRSAITERPPLVVLLCPGCFLPWPSFLFAPIILTLFLVQISLLSSLARDGAFEEASTLIYRLYHRHRFSGYPSHVVRSPPTRRCR